MYTTKDSGRQSSPSPTLPGGGREQPLARADPSISGVGLEEVVEQPPGARGPVGGYHA